MTVTTAKEFMQVIAKHYEKCRAVYWDVMHGIILIGERFVKLEGLPEDPEERQGVAIMHAILPHLLLNLWSRNIPWLQIFCRKCMKNLEL